MIRFRPVSLGVFSEEGRKYTDSLGSEHDLSQRLGFLVLGSYLEDTGPLFVGGPLGQIEGLGRRSLDTAHEEGTH